MTKVNETQINKGKDYKVKIEKIRTDTATYKTLSFTIYHKGKLVYQKSDIQKIYN